MLLVPTIPSCAPGPSDVILEPHVRFVDLAPTTGHWATIGDEKRLVLGGNGQRRAEIQASLRVDVPVAGPAALSADLGPSAGSARYAVVVPTVRLQKEEAPLPPRLVSLPARPAAPEIRLDIDPRAAFRGQQVAVDLQIYPLSDPTGASLETQDVEIPSGAVLEFGFGVLEPAWEQGAVAFSVALCPRPSRGLPDAPRAERQAQGTGAGCHALFRETLAPRPQEAQVAGWQERTVPLDAYGGLRASFRFRTALEVAVTEESTRAGPGAAEARSAAADGRDTATATSARHPAAATFTQHAATAFTLAVWSNPTIYRARPRRPDEVNILLVSLDTLRADHLPSYGHTRNTAPFLDRKVRRDGTLIAACVAAAPLTAPAHMTLFTSLPPSVHSVADNAKTRRLSPSVPTIAEILRAHGLETAAVTEGGALRPTAGFDRGFDEYTESNEPDTDVRHTFLTAERWLARNKRKRFFLFVHTYQAHWPYAPREPYTGLFHDGGVPSGLPPHWNPVHYDMEIRYLDDEIRRLIGTLEAEGLADDTIVVVTADHGEEFFEHGEVGHGVHLYQEVLHVPLLLWGATIPAGRHLEIPVGQIDVMPTLLDLAGVPKPAELMGQSFAGLLRGSEEAGEGPGAPLYAETHGTVSVRLGHRKLIQTPDGQFEYFDLARDPAEKDDLYKQRKEEVEDLQRLLDAYRASTRSMRERLAVAARAPRTAEATSASDRARDEKLRALGYLAE
jgi:arylsulfatase A-like enzyme